MSEEKKEEFELLYKPYRRNAKIRMQVEVYHRSEQVIRFKISGGGRFIRMEKLLFKKTGGWKIIDNNFDFSGDTQQVAYGIFELQEKLDAWLDKDNQRPTTNPKYEH